MGAGYTGCSSSSFLQAKATSPTKTSVRKRSTARQRITPPERPTDTTVIPWAFMTGIASRSKRSLTDGRVIRNAEPRGPGMSELVIGMDVGSTTVKAVVIEPDSKKILWHDYQRHHTKQPEKVLELLTCILDAFPDQP